MHTILKSIKLSFMVNGTSIGYFSCKRGVRQGDYLFPLLFCLVEDVLCRSISLLVDFNQLQPMTSPRNYQTPSHILFADDIMVFCRGTKKNLTNRMALFKDYADASGQHRSFDMSKFYAGSLSHRRITDLAGLVGFSVGSLPCSEFLCFRVSLKQCICSL